MTEHPRIVADWLRRPETQAVFAALSSARQQARIVGGAVRNALIGKDVADIDIATPATPEQVIAAASAASLQVVPTGLQHGTVTVMSGGIPHEVTTLRRDVETDGRHAVVAFTDDWALDASRRDFTINALYCDADGTVYDPLGGYPDLVARRVRFIGDAHARIREDYLRILRFFRFSAQYVDGPIDSVGLVAACDLRAGLQHLSAERIRDEMLKTLAARNAADIIEVMFDHGFLVPILGLAPVPRHLRAVLTIAPHLGALGRLSALTIGTMEDALRLGSRFRLSTAEYERLGVTAWLTQRLQPGVTDRAARQWIYTNGTEPFLEALSIAAGRRGKDATWPRLRALAQTWQRPTFPLRGRDLIALGYVPGPSIGTHLRALEAWWMSEDFATDAEALLARVSPPEIRKAPQSPDT
jgi:poly(A) polymerase